MDTTYRQYVTDAEQAALEAAATGVGTIEDLAATTGIELARVRGWHAMRLVEGYHRHLCHPSVEAVDRANDPANRRRDWDGPVLRAAIRSLHPDLLSDQQVETWRRLEASGTVTWTRRRRQALATAIGCEEQILTEYIHRRLAELSAARPLSCDRPVDELEIA